MPFRLAPELAGATSWRHLLEPARAGWAAVGPAGFAARLGLRLGVAARLVPRVLRVAEWARRMAQHDDGTRSYSRSRAADAWSTAAALLDLRDRLRVAGWDGAGGDGGLLDGSPRLRDVVALERVEGPLLAGRVDVLGAIRAALPARLPFALRVELAVERGRFDAATLRLVDALGARGAVVVEAPTDGPRAPVDTDLGRLQRALLGEDGHRLVGDGSVRVLEAETPAEAADLLARWMVDHPERLRTLLAPGERALLDRTMVARGLPSPGLETRSHWRPALQVLPLRLELAFAPKDPRIALELLTLPGGPLPRRARRRLVAALKEAPGIGGRVWNDAVARAVEEAEGAGEGAGARLRAAIDTWFGGEAFPPAPGLPAARAATIAGEVATWARRRATEDEAERAAWREAAAVAQRMGAALRTLPADTRLARTQLAAMGEDALASGAGVAAGPGEVGRPACCASPQDVLPGAREVVWWGWAGADERLQPDPWLPAERAALLAAGLCPETRGAERAREAAAWRQPFLVASERVVLVRWRTLGGRPAIRHPVEDELAARLGDAWQATALVAAEELCRGDGWAPAVEERPPAAPIAWPAVWELPAGRLQPPDMLSFSALNQLFGCPLLSVLSGAGLRPGAADAVPDMHRILGDLTHVVLQEVATMEDVDSLTPDEIGQRAVEALDARLPGEASLLLVEGWEAEHRRARRAVRSAAARLAIALRAGGWRAVGSEVPVDGAFSGVPWVGAIDLLLRREDGTPGVIDLKFGRSADRRGELAEGAALQLALYASAVATPPAPAAYLTVGDARLLTRDADAFPGATAVDGPDLGAVLADAERAWAWWRRVLDAGLVPARGVDRWDEPCVVVAGPPPTGAVAARAEAPCKRCAFDALCHLSLEHTGCTDSTS